MKIKFYVQSKDSRILNEAYGTVFNMLLHGDEWLNWIKKNGKPFLLVHGGFQGRMARIEDIISFSLEHRPELIIAPDIYKDQPETTRLTRIFVNKAPERLIKRSAAVLQCGLAEFEQTKKLYEDFGFKWIAIPSDSGLMDLCNLLKEEGWKVHVLGARDAKLPMRYFDSIDIVTEDYGVLSAIKVKACGLNILTE